MPTLPTIHMPPSPPPKKWRTIPAKAILEKQPETTVSWLIKGIILTQKIYFGAYDNVSGITTSPHLLAMVTLRRYLELKPQSKLAWELKRRAFTALSSEAHRTNNREMYVKEYVKEVSVEGRNCLDLNLMSIEDLAEIERLEDIAELESLDLSDNHIQVLDCQHLAPLTKLQTLNLSGNLIRDLRGIDPLPALRTLNLHRNYLKEIKGLELFPQLRELDLSLQNYDYRIQEIKGLDPLVHLQELNLSSNNIKEIKGLDPLTALRKLHLNSNDITEVMGLDRLDLQWLDLSANKITEIRHLNLPNLQWLDLSANKITEIRHLNLPNLQWLDLNGNRISNIHLEAPVLTQLRQLQSLDLGANQITQLYGFPPLTQLQNLWLGCNQITEIQGLDHLSQLQRLRLNGNQITGLKGLPPLPQLQVLDLSENAIQSLAGIENCPNLHELHLAKNQITTVRELAPLTQLEVLNLSENRIATTAGLEALPHLRWLDLRENGIETLAELDRLRPLAPLLEYLDLRGNPVFYRYNGEGYYTTWPFRDMGVCFSGVQCESNAAVRRFFEDELKRAMAKWATLTAEVLKTARAELQTRIFIEVREIAGKIHNADSADELVICDIISDALARDQLHGDLVSAKVPLPVGRTRLRAADWADRLTVQILHAARAAIHRRTFVEIQEIAQSLCEEEVTVRKIITDAVARGQLRGYLVKGRLYPKSQTQLDGFVS